MKLKKRKHFNILFWAIAVLMVVVSVHFMLWNNEPEGYFEIFAAEGFLAQFFVNVLALLLLVKLLETLIEREFRVGETALTSARTFAFYLAKALLLPLALALPFAYSYFWWFGVELEWTRYIQRVLPVLFLFVLFVNLVLLVRYLLLRLVLLQRGGASVDEQAGKDAGETPSAAAAFPKIQLYYQKKPIEADREDIVSVFFADHSVRVVLRDGRRCRHAASLKNFMVQFEGDDRFFATGRWMVNARFVDGLEDTYTRKKLVRMQPPFEDIFELPKEKVSEFRQWFGCAQQGRAYIRNIVSE